MGRMSLFRIVMFWGFSGAGLSYMNLICSLCEDV